MLNLLVKKFISNIEVKQNMELMLDDWSIRQDKKRLRQLARKLMHFDDRYKEHIIVSTINFYGYGKHVFKINCKNNLLFEQAIEAIWSSRVKKWNFYDAESGERINKSLTKIFGDFVRKCKKQKRMW